MIDLSNAKLLDKKDVLSKFHSLFYHQKNEIYFDGNSLGKLPLQAQKTIEEAVQKQWGEGLIRSWNQYWLSLSSRISDKYSELLGAEKGEIIIGESTSVSLYQVTYALLKEGNFPKQLSTDILNFPTDLYVLEGLGKSFEIPPLKIISYKDEVEAEIEILKASIKNNPGIVCLSLVSYKSAYLYPMKQLNRWASKHQSIIVWDLSHAVGAVAIDLKETETIIALGCTYKYMNGGPGAPAFLYINKEWYSKLSNPIQGWFGHQHPFNFSKKYEAANSIKRFASGTPAILSLIGMEAGIDITLEAGIKLLQEKSIQQSEAFIKEVINKLVPLGFSIESPLDHRKRGSHVTISHYASWQICQALIAGNGEHPKIIPDFRPPHFIRFGITPLYTRFEEIKRVIEVLREIAERKLYLNFPLEKLEVT
ncbi:aminotransferase class V-fold PLP-dependent enzyme [Flavobacteriaceae bacterium]|jgi:kynureninase|nr:aminotransferase class V-fold PLP-dependent enzyme [Flavobacteriaceae bacterium]